MKIIEFIFENGFHFWGTVLLLLIIFDKPFVMINKIKNKGDD